MIVAVAAVVGFVGLLVFTTLSQRGAECTVCMELAGRRHCSTVSAPTREEARAAGQRGACGILSNSVTSDLQCQRRRPVSEECRD